MALALARDVGFVPRSQRILDDLARAALESRLPAPTPERRAALAAHLSRVRGEVARVRSIAGNERRAAALTKNLADLAALVATVDPSKASGIAACAAGSLSAGAVLHALFAPIAKFNALFSDAGGLVAILAGGSAPPRPTADPALDAARRRAAEERQKRIMALMARYAAACAELGELAQESSGQREFFLKLKEIDRLDSEIARLTYAR